ncbi:MAG: hypothetical protein WC799_16275 [Desulfobacteraceae bacterium]
MDYYSIESQRPCMRCGFDRRYEDDRRTLYNVMPLGYNKRSSRIERRVPVERRKDWMRHTRWGSVGPDYRISG